MAQQTSTNALGSSYSPGYRDQVFYQWFGEGQPSLTDFSLRVLPYNGKSPSKQLLWEWHKKYNWSKRAEEMQARVRQEIEDELISATAKMLGKHAGIGRQAQAIALDWFENNQVTSQFAAIQLLKFGVELEAESANLENLFNKVRKLDDPAVKTRLEKLLSKTKKVE